MSDILDELGPLAALVGSWQGEQGDDKAPDDDRVSVEHNLYRETMTFTPTGEVNNHEQSLFGLRYATMVWRLDADSAFHEEVGYWLWDAENRQIMKAFSVPRGYTALAGGTADADATSFELAASVDSESYGINSNLFLTEEFKTVRYELRVDLLDEDTFSYESNTLIQIKGQDELFNHLDTNTLRRIEDD